MVALHRPFIDPNRPALTLPRRLLRRASLHVAYFFDRRDANMGAAGAFGVYNRARSRFAVDGVGSGDTTPFVDSNMGRALSLRDASAKLDTGLATSGWSAGTIVCLFRGIMGGANPNPVFGDQDATPGGVRLIVNSSPRMVFTYRVIGDNTVTQARAFVAERWYLACVDWHVTGRARFWVDGVFQGDLSCPAAPAGGSNTQRLNQIDVTTFGQNDYAFFGMWREQLGEGAYLSILQGRKGAMV